MTKLLMAIVSDIVGEQLDTDLVNTQKLSQIALKCNSILSDFISSQLTNIFKEFFEQYLENDSGFTNFNKNYENLIIATVDCHKKLKKSIEILQQKTRKTINETQHSSPANALIHYIEIALSEAHKLHKAKETDFDFTTLQKSLNQSMSIVDTYNLSKCSDTTTDQPNLTSSSPVEKIEFTKEDENQLFHGDLQSS